MNPHRFLLHLLWRHKLSYLLGFVSLVATLAMTFAIPRYLEAAIDILRSHPDPHGAGFLSRIYWILGFAVAIMATRTASRIFFFVPGRRIEFDLKNELLAHLARLERGYFLANPSGALISRINNDINGIRMLMGFGLLQLTNSLATFSIAPYLMYTIAPTLTVFVALPILLVFMVQQYALGRLRHLQQAQMQHLQELSDFTVESYNGLDTLRSYRALEWAESTFTASSERIRLTATRMAALRAFFMPLLPQIVNALKVLLVLFGGVMVVNAELSLGEFTAYLLYLTLVLPPLMGMAFMLFVLQRGLTALGSLATVLDTAPTRPDADPNAERALPDVLQQGLTVQQLSFAYPDQPDNKVLDEIDFSVAPGEIVGLFGAIGSGKSTLVNLINGYLDPPPGNVLLDGVDVTRLSLARLRRHVVTVTQTPFLFSDTLRENVRFAAERDDESAIRQALTTAALDADIARFPAGIDTIAGEKGVNLSGGQKQRLSLARALLKPCDLLILDDVLSAVDHETERYLIGQIYGFQQARMLLIVSHRISVLAQAQRIVVLEQGRIVAVGTHEELIRQPGVYRQAYRMQSEDAA